MKNVSCADRRGRTETTDIEAGMFFAAAYIVVATSKENLQHQNCTLSAAADKINEIA